MLYQQLLSSLFESTEAWIHVSQPSWTNSTRAVSVPTWRDSVFLPTTCCIFYYYKADRLETSRLCGLIIMSSCLLAVFCVKRLQRCQQAQRGGKAIRIKASNVPTSRRGPPEGFLFLNKATGNGSVNSSWNTRSGSLALQQEWEMMKYNDDSEWNKSTFFIQLSENCLDSL